MIKPKLNCKDCEHLILGVMCKAFPLTGIPSEIYEQKVPHDSIIEGQFGNYIFTKRVE